MSSEYSVAKSGKLKLKGEKSGKKSSSSKKRRDVGDGEAGDRSDRKRAKMEVEADIKRNGGWWKVSELRHLKGPVCIQMRGGGFVRALDDGSFTVGAPHDEGSGPDPEEVLMAVQVGDTKVAFKSGYEKYVRVEAREGSVKGTSDAIGPMEQWEPVFQDGQLALMGGNNRFLSVDEGDETVVCDKQRAGDGEMIYIRSNALRDDEREKALAAAARAPEESGSVGQVELNYVKKFQKFQDHKIRLNNTDRRELLKARDEGALHEAMLDRRAKMKADRYCK